MGDGDADGDDDDGDGGHWDQKWNGTETKEDSPGHDKTKSMVAVLVLIALVVVFLDRGGYPAAGRGSRGAPGVASVVLVACVRNGRSLCSQGAAQSVTRPSPLPSVSGLM